MDKSCDELMRTRNDPIPEYVEDVWEAEFLRTFEGRRRGRSSLTDKEKDVMGSLLISIFSTLKDANAWADYFL